MVPKTYICFLIEYLSLIFLNKVKRKDPINKINTGSKTLFKKKSSINLIKNYQIIKDLQISLTFFITQATKVKL